MNIQSPVLLGVVSKGAAVPHTQEVLRVGNFDQTDNGGSDQSM